MPDESPGATPDPIAALEQSMRTTVGHQETALRSYLGNEAYEKWKADQDEAAKLHGAQASASFLLLTAQVEHVKAQTGLATARRHLLSIVSLAGLVGILLAVALVAWVIA